MLRIFRTVKARIVALMLCFALLITGMVVAFSVNMMQDFRLETVRQSTEFNLQLIAGMIERELIDLVALANWCSFPTNPMARYLAGSYTPRAAMEAFYRLQEEVRNSRVTQYVDRIIVTDTESDKVLHMGTNTTHIHPFTKEGLSFLGQWPLGSDAQLYGIGRDPMSRPDTTVIHILAPVYHPITYAEVGTVYLAASSTVVTDKLRGYNPPDGVRLYLTIHGNHYAIEADGAIVPTDVVAENAISCTVRDGVTLTQVFSDTALLPLSGEWFGMLLGICALILMLALAIIFTLNAIVSRPVARIRRKIDAIGQGDFTPAPEIESDSEIGEVGQGVNRLSRDVVDLMNSRLADEKSQRELEYRMLQSQINPHFLYNTLGAIKWMATLQKAEGIAEMTTALSRLLKTVAKDVRKVVPLREELSLLDDYYTILKYRYGGAVHYERHIEDDALLDCPLPRFVLQPLMENAIFHGIEPKGNGHITLCVARDGGDVCIAMQDDGVGIDADRIAALLADEMPAEGESSYSLGLRSVHARVRSVFGLRYGLRIESEAGAYTRMTIRIPQNGGEKAI